MNSGFRRITRRRGSSWKTGNNSSNISSSISDGCGGGGGGELLVVSSGATSCKLHNRRMKLKSADNLSLNSCGEMKRSLCECCQLLKYKNEAFSRTMPVLFEGGGYVANGGLGLHRSASMPSHMVLNGGIKYNSKVRDVCVCVIDVKFIASVLYAYFVSFFWCVCLIFKAIF